jgi:hypothetical protein
MHTKHINNKIDGKKKSKKKKKKKREEEKTKKSIAILNHRE